MARRVTLVEVGPRDGLQGVQAPAFVATQAKLHFVDLLVEAGLKKIEVTSAVSPRWIPQMRDHQDVLAGVPRRDDVQFVCVVPNTKGLEGTLQYPPDEITFPSATTDSFCVKNVNCTVEESLYRLKTMMPSLKERGIRVRVALSCAFGCPYEGDVPVPRVVELANRFFRLGCNEIVLADTVGKGGPQDVRTVVSEIVNAGVVPVDRLALHIHTTPNKALSMCSAGLEAGLTIFDTSASGLGGCPFAGDHACGNVATELLVNYLEQRNIRTGIDSAKLQRACTYIRSILTRHDRGA